jgi:rhodanese-related sulfurtransferase
VRITRILILVALAVLCGAVSNLTASRERRLAWVGGYSPAARTAVAPASGPAAATATPPGTAAAAGAFTPHPDKAWVEIDGEPAARLHHQGAVFLDARRSSVYKDGHIQGARSFPVWESDIDARVKAFFEEGRDQRAPIVVYCSGGDCEDSHMLSEKLYFVGFDNALVYKDGHIRGARSFPVWESDIDARVKAFFEEGRDQRAPIVVYCSGGDCEDSHMLSEKLYFVGFDDALVYKGGFPDWQKRSLPVSKGDQP